MADTELAQAQEAISPVGVHSPTSIKPHRLNNHALACALLASTNSILLGYGKPNFTFLSFLVDVPFPNGTCIKALNQLQQQPELPFSKYYTSTLTSN
jgi:hypothetical protein